MKCPLCKTEELKLELSGVEDREYSAAGSYDFARCPCCSLLVLDPMPSIEQLKDYYPPDYHGFTTAQRGLVSLLYNVVYFFRFRDYERLIGKGGRILDVGCADAPYFDPLNKRNPNMDLMGVEFKDEIAEKGRQYGRNIITGTIDDLLDTANKFDLIIMNNLIEHVLDPIGEMKKACQLLKPNGYIIMETPNTDCWDYIISKKYWGGLHVPRHTYLFSSGNLKLLAEQTGFIVEDIKYLLNTDHWAISVQNYLQSTSKFKTNVTRGRVWYFKYLLFIFIPLNFLQVILKKTGAINIILRKNG